MTVTLTSLAGMVEGATEAEVRAAVADYSSRNPLYLYGQAQRDSENEKLYPLPADFLFLVKLEEAGLPGHYVVGSRMYFTIRPYPDTLNLWYAGQHVADETGAFPYLGDDEAAIIALKLKALVLGRTPVEGGGLSYRVGDVEVDASRAADGRNKEVLGLEQQYLSAVKVRVGRIGIRSEYPNYVNPATF